MQQDALKHYLPIILQMAVSLMGEKPVGIILKKAFPRRSVPIQLKGGVSLTGEMDREVAQEVVELITKEIASDFGPEFAEDLLRQSFDTFQKKNGNGAVVEEVLDLIPEKYLEHEKIKRLPKRELEKRVLERTRELMRANEELEHQKEQLEELAKAKTEFISLVAHQLQAPLTAIRWATVDLKKSLDPSCVGEQEMAILDKIPPTVRHMTFLVQNLLSIARIEEKRLEYKFQQTSLNDLVRSAVENLSEIAKQKSIVVEVKLAQEDVKVHADLEKLYIVVENIIDNAIKYTKESGIITIKTAPEEDHGLFQVMDEGMGIPEEEQEKVFGKYFRASNAQKRESGTGVGLYIVKKIVDDHQGSVYFQSKEGKGTTFTVRIPMIS